MYFTQQRLGRSNATHFELRTQLDTLSPKFLSGGNFFCTGAATFQEPVHTEAKIRTIFIIFVENATPMKRFLPILLIALAVACSQINKPMTQAQYVDWLYKAMPLPDSLTHERQYWEANVAKTLEVRSRMNWNIPEREFRHFVLPLRVNNETLDDFRTLYADTLCARVEGLTLGEAALEINHWCHEQATYRPSDARTSSPTMTMRYGYGRCGEESVLTVAALRAAGIPARQVYTPRWAHTDDNHAWVEIWADGRWWFMGACEPEPRLNMAWFNAPVSRAMILHTNVYGDYHGPEDVIRRTPCFTEINVINGYVPARRTTVMVEDTSGRPVAGAQVEFKIYNYAEFYTVARYTTDAQGITALNTGVGDMLIWAWEGQRFGFAVASGPSTTVVLDRVFGERFGMDMDIHPPVEDPIRTRATVEEIARNSERLGIEDAIRAAHDHSNHDVADRVWPKALLATLTEKDLRDVSAEVLEDALLVNSTDPYVLSPRVELEALRPFRGEVLEDARSLSGMTVQSPPTRSGVLTGDQIAQWVRENITVVDNRNPLKLRIPPISVWRSKMSDKHSLGIFYVALCRTLGVPSRIDPVTGKVQYRSDNQWVEVKFDEEDSGEETAAQGLVILTCEGGPVADPMYYKHFTIAKIEDGSAHLYEFGTDADETPLSTIGELSLDEGYYVVTTGSRLADGGVLAHLEFLPVRPGEPAVFPLIIRDATLADYNASPSASSPPDYKR